MREKTAAYCITVNLTALAQLRCTLFRLSVLSRFSLQFPPQFVLLIRRDGRFYYTEFERVWQEE